MVVRPQSAPRSPLLLGSLAFSAGILAGARWWRPAVWWLIAACVFTLAALLFAMQWHRGRPSARRAPLSAMRSWIAFALALAAFVALGAVNIQMRYASQPDLRGWQQLTEGDDVTVTGHVMHDGVLRGSGAQQRQSVDVQVETVEGPARVVEPEPETDPSASEPPRRPRPKRASRAHNNCVANAIYSPELLRAAGLPLCLPESVSTSEPDKAPPPAPTAILLPRAGTVGNGHPEGAIRLSVYSRDPFDEADDSPGTLPQVFTYGQRLRFPAKLRPPRNFGNPGAFDYAGYLRANGIFALGSVRADRIGVLDGLAGSRAGLLRSHMRRSVLSRIHQLWPRQQAALLDAMLIGERSFVGRDINTAFQRTGIYHILVVSGMNVGMLAFIVFWALRRVHCSEVVATVLTILLACGYAYLAESGAPIVRSVLMLSVYLCTRLLYRDRAMLNALGAAALTLLVIDPAALHDPSFKLTFLSVLAIAGIAVPLLGRTSQPLRNSLRWLPVIANDTSHSPRLAQFRLDLRLVASRIALLLPRWPSHLMGRNDRQIRAAQHALTSTMSAMLSVFEVLIVSAISQIALALPMAWYFHRATVVGLAANVVAVPLTGVLMPASVAAVALSYYWTPLARVPGAMASWSLAAISATVNHLATLRAADLRLATPTTLTCAFALTAFIVAVLFAWHRRLLALASLAALTLSAVWIVVAPAHPQVHRGALEVTSIDVGQAESTLVVTPEGRTLLVDASGPLGPWQSDFDYGEDVIAPYLWWRGIGRLDAVAVTHAHSDHYGGMASIITAFRPRELWVGPNAPDRGYDALLKSAQEHGVTIVRRTGGDGFAFGGAGVQVLSPAPEWQPGARPKNDDSLVLRLSYGNTSAVLAADAEKKSEHGMTALRPRTDVLKVAHNGSRTSTTREFLDALQPRYAVISVGARNSFRHPSAEVLERLADRRVATYRTDMLGAVTFYLDGRQVTPTLPLLSR